MLFLFKTLFCYSLKSVITLCCMFFSFSSSLL
nr:MAG TPA: hypothetical protein [Caudoviricetes sp.]